MKTDADTTGVDASSIDAGYPGEDNIEVEKSSFNAAINLAEGRGGETQRGLKSRHIQFLYASSPALPP